jgi:hypothetical protein
MVQRLLRHLQGELFSMLRIIVTLCDYIRLQLLYSYFKKKKVCFNVKLKMLQTCVITKKITVLSKQKKHKTSSIYDSTYA